MSIFDSCCGTIFPLAVIVGTIMILFLNKKTNLGFRLRSLRYDEDAVLVISRLFGIGIALIIVTIFHVCSAMGIGMWDPLLSISVACAIVFTGAIISVIGLKAGFYIPVMLGIVCWVLMIYIYIQFEANII